MTCLVTSKTIGHNVDECCLQRFAVTEALVPSKVQKFIRSWQEQTKLFAMASFPSQPLLDQPGPACNHTKTKLCVKSGAEAMPGRIFVTIIPSNFTTLHLQVNRILDKSATLCKLDSPLNQIFQWRHDQFRNQTMHQCRRLGSKHFSNCKHNSQQISSSITCQVHLNRQPFRLD